MARPDGVFGWLVTAAQVRPPRWRVALSPRWARLLIVAGARPAPAPDAMTRVHEDPSTTDTHSGGDSEPSAAPVDFGPFRGLDPEVRQQMIAAAEPYSYRKGQVLFEQGDLGDSLVILRSGVVALYRSSASGERRLLSIVRPPDVLGEISLLDGSDRYASAEAIEDCTTLVFSRAAFLNLVRTDPAILDAVLRSLGGLIRRLTQPAADRIQPDFPGIVARALVRIVGPSGGPTFTVELDQTQLAELTGGSRQAVNQAIGAFADQGWLRTEGRRIVVTDLPALRMLAGLDPLDSSLQGAGRHDLVSSAPVGRRPASRTGATAAASQPATRTMMTGATQPEKGRRIVGAERQALAKELVRRYREGESIRALASSTGRSYGFVHRVLTESGVELPRRGGARRRKKPA